MRHFTSLASLLLWVFAVGHCLVEWQHCSLSQLPSLPGHHHDEDPASSDADHHVTNCELQSTRPSSGIGVNRLAEAEPAYALKLPGTFALVLAQIQVNEMADPAIDFVPPRASTSVRLRTLNAPNAPPTYRS